MEKDKDMRIIYERKVSWTQEFGIVVRSHQGRREELCARIMYRK